MRMAALSPQTVDIVCMLAGLIGPVVGVLIFRAWGIPLGALWLWGTFILAGRLLNSLDPHHEGALLDSVWLLTGWLVGLVYSAAVYGLYALTRRLRAH